MFLRSTDDGVHAIHASCDRSDTLFVYLRLLKDQEPCLWALGCFPTAFILPLFYG